MINEVQFEPSFWCNNFIDHMMAAACLLQLRYLVTSEPFTIENVYRRKKRIFSSFQHVNFFRLIYNA